MHHLEKRIFILESIDRNPIQFVWRNLGETPDEAITSAGASEEDMIIISRHEGPRKLEIDRLFAPMQY